MSNDVIFYTQLASFIAFIVALFLPYKVLVAQKDATIELLRQEIDTLKRKLSDAQSQSPDILVAALSSRVEISEEEILRLKQDSDIHQSEIDKKETQLHHLKRNLSVLQELLEDSEFVCPKCKAPLVMRGSHTIFGYVNGRECEADIEYIEYECGFSMDGGEKKSPCRSSVNTPLGKVDSSSKCTTCNGIQDTITTKCTR